MEEENLSSPPKPPSPPLRTSNAPRPARRFFVAPKKSKIQPPSIELPTSTEEPILIPNPTEDSNLSNITLADKSHKKIMTILSSKKWIRNFLAALFLITATWIALRMLDISSLHLKKTQDLLTNPNISSEQYLREIDNLRSSFSLFGFFLILSLLCFTSCFTVSIMNFFKKRPQTVFVSIITLGGLSSFFLPLTLYYYKYIGETKDLSTMLLTVTGGTLAVFTLLKTHQKNLIDEENLKLEKEKHTQQILSAAIAAEERQAEILRQEKNNDEQKRQFMESLAEQRTKDKRDYIRQVHTERRNRYAIAVGQLADDKLVVRLGGVYTLVGLVDEWLADDNITPEEQKKEGQVIINNLCAYIRSPFPLAKEWKIFSTHKIPKNYKGNFISNQTRFHEEQDVRKTILNEIENRLRSKHAETQATTNKDDRGPWSDFKYDFRGATFFYSVEFMSCHFGKWTSFSNAKFIDSVFFHNSTFTNWAGFFNTRFKSSAYFHKTSFFGSAVFSRSSFAKYADFSGSFFTNTQVTIDPVDFAEVKFRSADFSGALFQKSVCFREASFKDFALFYRTRFVQQATFNGATFNKSVSFEGGTFNNTPPTFSGYIEEFEYISRFSNKINPDKYNFNVSPGSIHSIELGTAELDGKKFMIPMGSLLFNPRSWDNKTQKYTHTSDPAKPIEESDNQGETPSK